MNNRNDEAAFPVPIGQTDERQWGMSLRDWFAGQVISAIWQQHEQTTLSDLADAASTAYQQADAMMEAREANQ